MNTREQIKKQLEGAALTAGDKVAELLRQVNAETDPEKRKALQLRLQAAAIERDNCLAALFETPRTLG